jgi:hypothetical protein
MKRLATKVDKILKFLKYIKVKVKGKFYDICLLGSRFFFQMTRRTNRICYRCLDKNNYVIKMGKFS